MLGVIKVLACTVPLKVAIGALTETIDAVTSIMLAVIDSFIAALMVMPLLVSIVKLFCAARAL